MTDALLERLLTLDAEAGPALAIDAAHANELIDAALAGAGFGPGGSGGDGSGHTGSGGGRGNDRGVDHSGSGGASARRGTAVGTKVAIVGAAAIVVVAVVLLLGRGRHRGHEAAIPPADAAIVDDRGGSGSLAMAATATAPSPPGDEPTAEPTAPSPADATVASTESAENTEPSDDDIEIDTPPPTGPTHTKPAPKPSAADLLGEANAKRAAKQWRESDRLYARVVDRAPKTLAAQTALIASASLHLEHFHDPKGAARRLRKALAIAPSGALAEEARWGLAEAARATHDTEAEAEALDDFLVHHAGSPLAPRAKARRAELP